MTTQDHPLPATGGTFIRQLDGTLVPVEAEAPETEVNADAAADAPNEAAKTGRKAPVKEA